MTRRRPPLQNNSAKADAQISGLANVEDTSLDASGGRPILIEIDPVISGGEAHGRFDVMVRGRAVSPAAIKEIRLQVDGWVTSIASFGQPDSAPSAFMPDGSPARQRVFQFNLPRPGDGRTERCAFQIVAHIEDGFEYVEDFEIEIDPTAGEVVSIVSGSIRSAPGASGPHAILYLERATINAQGGLFLQGWAVSLRTILAVQVFAGEMQVAEARIGEERDDVAAAFPAYPNSRFAGFSLALELDEVARKADRIRAQVVCVDGFFHAESVPIEVTQLGAERGLHHGHELVPDAPLSQQAVASANQTSEFGVESRSRIVDDLMPSPGLPAADGTPPILPLQPMPLVGVASQLVQVQPTAEIEMFCDTAVLTDDGTLSIGGWAVCGVGIVQVRVLLDEKEIGLASYGHDRPDVSARFPEIRMSHLSGFRFDRCIDDRFSGEHEVRVVVRNGDNKETARRLAVTVTNVLACEPRLLPEGAPTEAGSDLPSEQEAEFRFELDSPQLSNGEAFALVTGHLTLDGWLLTRSGIASFEIFLDDQRLGDAHYGLARQDVGAAFPEWPNALRSGYAFHCPPRSLRDGDHTVQLRIRSNNGMEFVRAFGITVKKAEDQLDIAGIRRRIPRVEADMMSALLVDMNCRPTFQFILKLDQSIDPKRMRATLDALRLQAYPDWNVLVLARDYEVLAATKVIIDEWVPHLASRFELISPSNLPAWTASLADPGLGGAVLYTLLLPGDELGADAMLEMALACGRHPGRDLLYGDEIRISPISGEQEAFFKPDFSIDLLLSTNYIGRPWAVTGALLAKTGATPASLIADGEYDLVLQCVDLATGIHHIPKLLCQRSAMDLDNPCQERAALERTLSRRGISAEILSTSLSGTWRIKRTVPSKGKVSIIIPTCAAHGYIETCIATLRSKTAYRDFEIICIDNIPDSNIAWKVWLQQNSDKVVDIPEAFNWSSFNNRAAAVADGEFLLFLNDDIEIIQEDWLDAMMEHVRRPEVGIIGPQLLYSDGKVQHAGMFLSNNGIGRHAFRFAAKDDPCYFGLALTQRNVIAVTGACMLVRRETFDQIGGFDEAHEIVNNDLDFCLRVHKAGLLTVFTPYATLVHHELASRAAMKDTYDLTHFNAAWKTTFAAGDPFFNPRLSRHADDYRPDDEPVQWVVSGAPMFHSAEIQRILVVKLDHIGDFVTALPPIRRLKKLFPHARITVLGGPASRAFVSLESCIDEFIPFTFFHARSQLGERELTADDYSGLAEQLRPYRFDLAVDLRKHLSTRDILKCTGARFLAGFDYLGQFPFLDIALDWDGDRALQRKRSHVVDDLMALVNAIGHASEADRVMMQPGPVAMKLTELPDEVRALFCKPVVAVHPGAGNVTKQWPVEHFSALIDLLVERNDVNIMLVGGPDEVEIADTLLANVQRPDTVVSMAGKTLLADLPRLLKNCALYIGNDSGPKHIAAAVGIPTVGIHSGVVDPVEWGPIGPNAVALRRNMSCSPCYLARAEDCPRSLACLRFLEPNLVYETADLLLTRPRPRLEVMAETEGTAYGEAQPLEETVSASIANAASNIAAPSGTASARGSRAKRRQRATEPV